MPLTIFKALGIVPTPSRRKVTQLDKTEVNIVGEINWIPMQIAVDPRVQQVIYIQVVDILATYRIILGWDFIQALNGCAATDFSHLWLPWKGLPNYIRIDQEPHMNFMIIEYNNTNEVLFFEIELGNYCPMAY